MGVWEGTRATRAKRLMSAANKRLTGGKSSPPRPSYTPIRPAPRLSGSPTLRLKKLIQVHRPFRQGDTFFFIDHPEQQRPDDEE